MIIQKNDWFLEVDLNGGRIKELKYKDNIILGTYERIDGKIGNTHVCVPNFGEEGVVKFGLPFHGPFRNSLWSLVEDGDLRLVIECEINNLKVKQEFLLSGSFEHKISMENKGKTDIPVNIGIHNYFEVLKGWLGTKINNVDVSEIIKNDDYFKINKENIISLPEGETYKWELKGFNWVRLWTGRSGDRESVMFDHNYVCIEPVVGKEKYFGSEESLLKPGKVKEVTQKIRVVYRT